MNCSMLPALATALVGGFCLAVFGVAISVMNRMGRDTFAYLFWNALFTVPPAFFLLGDPGAALHQPLQRFPELLWWIAGGGVASIGGSLCIQAAMKHGNNNLVWAIQQAAMLIPFFTGAVFFEQRCSIFQAAGAGLIVFGIFYPVWRDRSAAAGQWRRWLPFALGAFLLTGSSEAMQNVPSYWENWRDVGDLRSPLAYLGGAAGSGMAALLLRRRLLPLGPLWRPALFMAGWNLVTVWMMFRALDLCAAQRLGAAGFPVLIGSSIVCFSLYSLWIMKEKTSRAGWVGLLGILAGIAVIAL